MSPNPVTMHVDAVATSDGVVSVSCSAWRLLFGATLLALSITNVGLAASTFVVVQPENAATPKIDVSGYGQCTGSSINATKVWAWYQSPTPAVPPVPQAAISTAFVGKNAILWSTAADAAPATVSVRAVDGLSATFNKPHGLEGQCHFTIDFVHMAPSSGRFQF